MATIESIRNTEEKLINKAKETYDTVQKQKYDGGLVNSVLNDNMNMLTKLDKRYIYKYDELAIKTTLEQMLNDNTIVTIDVDIDTFSENKDQYCIVCGKSRYSDFTYVGSPESSKGWSSYKVCPTCAAKVEIEYPDPWGGDTKETINHINDFNKPYKVNK